MVSTRRFCANRWVVLQHSGMDCSQIDLSFQRAARDPVAPTASEQGKDLEQPLQCGGLVPPGPDPTWQAESRYAIEVAVGN